MAIWIDNHGWADGKDRYLFTGREFFRTYWGAVALGIVSFAPLMFFLGRMSAIGHWF